MRDRVHELQPGGAGEGDVGQRPHRLQEEGVTLLGAPLGTQEFMTSELEKKVEKIEEITGLLPLLQDGHTEFSLLRSCLSLPKLSFLLRTTDTSGMGAQLRRFDQVTREALTRIIGAPVHDQAWQQAKLPTALGGLGLSLYKSLFFSEFLIFFQTPLKNRKK